MKLASFSLALLALTSSVSAQYFSEGWAPGKAVTDEPPPPAATPGTGGAQPAAQQQGGGGLQSAFDLTKVLESETMSKLFSRFGINITAQIEAARAQGANTWDSRIPLITDDNYDDVVVKEVLTEEEEENRLWFIVITGQNTARGAMSKALDESFDSAYNTSIIAGDLPDVRWGRIDYLNVTYLTTKWNVWQVPYLVLIRDHGQTLYFYQANSARLTAEVIRSFLLEENWKGTHPWKTPFSPGGNYEFVLHYFAFGLQHLYFYLVKLPRWVLMIASGAVATLVMRLMHRNPESEVPKPEEKTEEKTQAPPAPKADATETKAASTSTPKKSSAKSRKGGKK
ncbi:hypothetical protein EIP91_010655 [Steccherinum ochraceum]|uniref:Thioredoxin domain-containing protein n=1 Tax=Steccherinum ochraceum TaxID=92696 RepID=A0A4R0RIR6_9APHY|nr:hypothetical protein EIP91_010655 [Steccherinum ochraceum]